MTLGDLDMLAMDNQGVMPNRIMQVQHYFSVSNHKWQWALLAMLGLLVLLCGVWLIMRQRRGGLRPGPSWVFHRIGKELGLGLFDRWLLARIAHDASLPSPLTLLMSDHTLIHYGERYAASRAKPREEQVLRQLVRIKTQLFTAPNPSPSEDQDAVGNRSEDGAD